MAKVMIKVNANSDFKVGDDGYMDYVTSSNHGVKGVADISKALNIKPTNGEGKDDIYIGDPEKENDYYSVSAILEVLTTKIIALENVENDKSYRKALMSTHSTPLRSSSIDSTKGI